MFLFLCSQAVKLTSVKAQLPYEYYSLPFCKPEKVVYKAENLGKILKCETQILCGLWKSVYHAINSISRVIGNRGIVDILWCIKSLLAGEVLRGDRIVNTLYNVSSTLFCYQFYYSHVLCFTRQHNLCNIYYMYMLYKVLDWLLWDWKIMWWADRH